MGHHVQTKEFVVGAAVGSLLGSVAALLLAPKPGNKLRQDICDTYCDFTERTQDMAKKGRALAKDISCQTCDWAGKARSAVEGVSKTVKGWVGEEEEDETARDLLIGGLIGGVIGTVAGLLLAPKSGEDLRHDIAETYDDISERTQDFSNHVRKRGKALTKSASSKANKWYDIAKDLVEDLTDEVHEKGEDVIDNLKGLVNNKRANDILNWAQLGYRAWNGLKSKKRR